MEDMMKPLKNLVVALLLTVWVGPTVAQAAVPSIDTGAPAAPAAPSPRETAVSPSALLALGTTPGQELSADEEAGTLAAREQAAPALQQYRGGGSYIYIGSGATLVLVLILLIILL
jgi:hypothetical protein